MKETVQDFAALPRRYENIDGTGEMSMGWMILAFSLLANLQAALPAGSRWRNGYSSLLFMFVILIPVLALGHPVFKAIKKYITWPRTGYVAYLHGGKSLRAFVAVSVLSGIISAGVVGLILIARRHGSIGLPRVLMLVIMAAPYAIWTCRSGREHRWKWLISLFMVLGLVGIALMVPGNVEKLFRPVSLFVGATWLASGAATLCSYIRRTHPPVLEAE